MVWRRKEKELTKEEAIELARKDQAPFWFNVAPLVTPVPGDNEITLFPLAKHFSKENWIFYFIDPTLFSFERMLDLSTEWQKRYKRFLINPVYIFHTPYEIFEQRSTIYRIVERYRLKLPIAIDPKKLLGKALGVSTWPSAVLIHKNDPLQAWSGKNWEKEAELFLQDFLRETDPGLPLMPPYDAPPFPKDSVTWEMGKEKPEGVELTGEWKIEKERAVTSDPKATLQFNCPGSTFSIMGIPLSGTVEAGRIQVLPAGGPAYETFTAKDLLYDDEGVSYLELREPRLYHAIDKLVDDKFRDITLKFPTAKRVPIGIYGFRFA